MNQAPVGALEVLDVVYHIESEIPFEQPTCRGSIYDARAIYRVEEENASQFFP